MYDGKRRILIGWIGDYKDSSDNGSYESVSYTHLSLIVRLIDEAVSR